MSFNKINPTNTTRSYTDRITFTNKPLLLQVAEYLGKAKRNDWQYYNKNLETTGSKPTLKERITNLKAFDIGDVYSKTIISSNDTQRALMWRTHKANRREWHRDAAQAKAKPKNKRLKKRAERAQANLDKTDSGPSICFGGRALWREAQTDTIKMEEFKNRRLFLGGIGRSDYYDETNQVLMEFGSNQLIRLNPQGLISILVPRGLRPQLGVIKKADFYQVVGSVKYNYGWDNLLDKLEWGESITYYFDYKSNGHWNLRAIAQLPSNCITTAPIDAVYAMGVDLNDRHLDVAIVSEDGNLIGRPFTLNYTNKRLDSTIDKLVSIAIKRGVRVIYIERLSGLQRSSTRGRGGVINKIVNNIPTGKFKSLLTSKCEVYGVKVIEVDPAGTSSNASDWFSVTRETDNTYKHKTSAYLIGRRGLGYTIERNKVAVRRRLDSGRVYAMLHGPFDEVHSPGINHSQASGILEVPF